MRGKLLTDEEKIVLGRLIKLIEKIMLSKFTGRLIIHFANGKPGTVEEIKRIKIEEVQR